MRDEKRERNRALVRRYQEGASFSQLSAEFGISHMRAHQIVSRAGALEERSFIARWHSIRFVVEGLLRGDSFSLIAKSAGLAQSNINGLLARRGVRPTDLRTSLLSLPRHLVDLYVEVIDHDRILHEDAMEIVQDYAARSI